MVWQDFGAGVPGESLLPRTALRVGEFLLGSGTIELELDDGARVTIQGRPGLRYET